MNDASTIPAPTDRAADIEADETNPNAEVYHNVKFGNCPALRAPKMPTNTDCNHAERNLAKALGLPPNYYNMHGKDLRQSPMLQAPDRIANYLRANPEVTVAIMSGIVRPAVMKALSKAARGVVPVPEVTASGRNMGRYCLCGNFRTYTPGPLGTMVCDRCALPVLP